MYTELVLKIELIKYIVNREYDIESEYYRSSLILTLIDDVLRGFIKNVEDIEVSINEYKDGY